MYVCVDGAISEHSRKRYKHHFKAIHSPHSPAGQGLLLECVPLPAAIAVAIPSHKPWLHISCTSSSAEPFV